MPPRGLATGRGNPRMLTLRCACQRNTLATPRSTARHVTPLRGTVAGGGCSVPKRYATYAFSVCDDVPLRRHATPSHDTVLRPSWDAPHGAVHTVCTLPPRVPTTGGGFPRWSVRAQYLFYKFRRNHTTTLIYHLKTSLLPKLVTIFKTFDFGHHKILLMMYSLIPDVLNLCRHYLTY